MNIAFRVDSSYFIGAGHLRRCLKLAEDLRFRSKKIIFICKKLSGNFNNLIKKKKFKIVLINKKSKNKINDDLRNTKYICKKFKINTLIIDHYYLGLKWERGIKKFINKSVIIDDFTKKEHSCDLIINNLRINNSSKIKHLTGLKYVIIANNFSKKKVKKKTKKIIIGTFFGSTDRLNCNGRLLKIFSQKEFNKFKFIFLLGKNNKNKVKIRKTYQKYQNFHFETKFINIRKFYKKLDILINVGGVTSFEALASNVKCIYIPINYYQKTTCDFLKKQKINNVLNYNQVFNKRGKKLLFNCLDKISKNRKSLTKNIHFDHHGSKRIADYILSKKFNKNLQFN